MNAQSGTPAAAAALLMHGAMPVPADASTLTASLIAMARDALRAAQVEIYCDHDGRALSAIRAARQAAIDSHQVEPVVRLAIDQAAWHVRHGESSLALAALDWARDHLLP